MNEKKLVLFVDSGDTFIDESTEIRDERGIVVDAQLFPGAAQALRTLHEMGYTIALVADGEVESFDNMYALHGLSDCFDARAISQALGDRKPARIMFQTAMDALSLTDADKPRIVMMGNNLKRDMVGANRFGIRSILIDRSPRYDMQPHTEEEIPTYIIHTHDELVPLIERLNAAL